MATLRLQYTVVPPDRPSKDCVDKSWMLYYKKKSKKCLKCRYIYIYTYTYIYEISTPTFWELWIQGLDLRVWNFGLRSLGLLWLRVRAYRLQGVGI